MSYKHLQHQVILLASVFLNLQSVYAYGRVVSDPVEGAQYFERPLLVLRSAAGAQIAQCRLGEAATKNNNFTALWHEDCNDL
jgi:hypothetical protein